MLGHRPATGGPPLPTSEDLARLAAEMAAWRRDQHQHPQLGFEEHRAAHHAAALPHGAAYWCSLVEAEPA